MSLMPKLMEINDELVRVREERDELRKEQSKLQRICADGGRRITELQDELRKACAERDQAEEHAARLQAQLAEVKSQLEAVVRERYNLQAERNTLDKQLQELIMSQPDFGVERMPKKNKPESQLVKEILSAMDQEEADDAPTEPKKPKKPVKTPAGQNDLVRDVSHYIEAAEVDRPTEPQPEQDGVLVQEGWWLQADGNRVCVRPTNPSLDNIWKINIGFKWSDGARLYMDDGSHNRNQTTPHDLVKFLGKELQSAEPQQPKPEPKFKPYTFAAYIVGDKSQPDALRIVWATEDWIQHSQFGIVHRMRDMQFFGNDTFTPDQFSVNLKIQ